MPKPVKRWPIIPISRAKTPGKVLDEIMDLIMSRFNDALVRGFGDSYRA